MQTHTDTTRGQTAEAADDDGGIDWRTELMTRWQALGLEAALAAFAR